VANGDPPSLAPQDVTPEVVDGDRDAFAVTDAADLALAEAVLAARLRQR
jgi:2-C-methyl-D-erythritol 4-phosphate cytidylyltransferase